MSSSICESCGANLPLPDLHGNILCPACGRRSREAPPAPAPPKEPAATPPRDEATIRMGAGAADAVMSRGLRRWRRLLIGLVVIAVVLPIVLAAGLFSKGVSTITKGSSNQIVLESTVTQVGTTGSTTELAAIVQRTGGGTYDRYVARVDLTSAGAVERWRSPAVGKDTSLATFARTPTVLFAAIERRLLALDAATGTIRWEATLPDTISPSCDTCLSAVGEVVVARTTNGVLTGYRSTSREPAWSHTLQNQQAPSRVAGDRVVVLDESEDRVPRLQAITATDGRVAAETAVTCQPDDEVWFSGARFVAATAEQVVVLTGTPDDCVFAWSPATGTERYRKVLPTAVTPAVGDDPIVVDGNRAAIATSDGFLILDLATGTAISVTKDHFDGANLAPIRFVGDRLLIATSSSRGTPIAGLAAVGVADGAKQWTSRLDGTSQWLDTDRSFGDTVFSGDSAVTVVGGAAPQLLTITSGPHFTVRPIDPATGTLGTARTVTGPAEDSSSTSVRLVASGDRVVVASTWTVRFFAATGTSYATYPT